MILPRASLRRSSRTRTRKNTNSADTDVECPPPHSSVPAPRKTRPPPLQIIPELSDDVLDICAAHSPATARPMQFIPQQPAPLSSRITLSAYTFSIDDALLMCGGHAPRSPALSASSTSDGASSEGVPVTPGISDEEDGYGSLLPTPRICPRRISIRPLCITKTHSLIYQEDEDIHNYFEEEGKVTPRPVTEWIIENHTETNTATETSEEVVQDFYTREFEDFISLLPAIPSPISPARRDSLILVAESLPAVVEVFKPKPRGRSRHSKPLPLLPPATPPISTFPLIPSVPLVQTTAQKSARRKRSIPPLPNHPPPPPVVSRPFPQMSVPLDIEDCVLSEEQLDVTSSGPIVVDQAHDMEGDANIYTQSSFTCTVPASARPLPPAVAETPLPGMHGQVTLPRSSTDSDAPRSSTDSTSSFASSTPLDAPFSSFAFPSSPSEERLRSRWSTSTLGSVVEPPRSTTLLSPLRSVFSSRTRWVLPPPQKMPPYLTPPRLPKNKHNLPATPSPPSTSAKHIRQQGSRSSTSSTGSSSECDSHDGSPSGLKRRAIPVAMFLRAT